MCGEFVFSKNDTTLIRCRIQPSASKTAFSGIYNDALKIALAAPPVDGKANKALTIFIAKILGISKSSVSIAKGEKSRDKVVACRNITIEEVKKIITAEL